MVLVSPSTFYPNASKGSEIFWLYRDALDSRRVLGYFGKSSPSRTPYPNASKGSEIFWLYRDALDSRRVLGYFGKSSPSRTPFRLQSGQSNLLPDKVLP